MRILHVHNLMQRHYGKRNSYTGRKFSNGIIRSNNNLYEFSDRDTVRFEAPLKFRPLGISAMHRKFLETCENFKPDLILLGHCDLLPGKLLAAARKIRPDVKISQWFLDALWIPRNIKRLKSKMSYLDSIFMTTAGECLKQFCTGNNRVCFIPNPCDPSFESHENSNHSKFEIDLLFCGVGLQSDDRYSLLTKIDREIGSEINFESYGIFGNPPIWGSDYEDILPKAKMALNLNREEGWPFYSSDRISQLMGNGILTFLWDKGNMRKLFTDEQVVFFDSEDALLEKILYFHQNDTKRKHVAKAGQSHYQQNFSAEKIIRFITEVTFDIPFSNDYVWSDEIYS